MFAKLRRYVIRKRFAAIVRPYDDAIEAARRAHKPTRAIEAAKAEYVRKLLAGAVR